MGSRLLNSLNRLTSTASPKPAKPIARVMLREHTEKANPALYRLSRDAVLRLGLTGGELDIERCAFIDTETTGLSGGAGTVAFLVGVGFVKDGLLTVRQFIMPDYSAEEDLLAALAETLAPFDTVVHFNGKRFDMPLLKTRFIMKRLEYKWRDLEELDLLYPARRVWKLRLGCCKLSYLEEMIFNAPRGHDIPGSEIPQRYFDSVKTGDKSLLDDVIEHNRQDIVTLTALLVKLNALYSKPESAGEQLDIFSLGKAFENLGEKQTARRLYTLAGAPRAINTVSDLRGNKYAGEANYRLYRLMLRSGEYDKCEQLLNTMLRRQQMGDLPRIELSKLYEHRLKRMRDALDIIEPVPEDEELTKRKKRLKTKLIKNGG